MGMKLHELHPAMIHSPLTLLPAAAVVDLVAAATCDTKLSRLGGSLWGLGAGAGLLAGLAGMAASQEVSTEDTQVSDAMYLHGIGNVGLVVAASAMALYRSRRPANIATAVIGLVASGSAIYTAYLGGELVYGSGLGVRAMSDRARAGAMPGVPEILSTQAPGRFIRDVGRGLSWLFRRTLQLFNGEQPFDRRALSVGKAHDGAEGKPFQPPHEAVQPPISPRV